ncbi:hypothetical protein [Cellvibrio mixtus]|uniref:hypothetical protein n=1 Tax=Cellvibrio mixtus TaxID=39650 RepID=UPI000586D774|nr:hypothetical protein [Cellvibrio mixtus]
MTKVPFVKALALISLVSLSSFASAYSFVSYKEVPGVVQSVSEAASTITIKTEAGETKTFNVVKGAKVATTKGRAMKLASLREGDTVTLKNRVSTPVAGEIKGKILAVNSEDLTVKLREHNTQNVLHVKFNEEVRATGIGSESFASLRSGNELVVRADAK